jgi:hypothetical protein
MAKCTTETLWTSYPLTQYDILEDQNPQLYHSEKLETQHAAAVERLAFTRKPPFSKE